MTTRTAHLVARLTDQVSGPAAKMAAGLKQAAAQAEALSRLSSKGGTGKFASDLRNLGASVSQIDAVTAAMKRYVQQIGASGNRADWTKEHRAQMRTWEMSTVASLKNVIAAERDQGRYTQAVVGAVGDILGKTKKGTVRASDAQTAAKAVGNYHKVAAQSVDVEGLLDALMKANATLAQLNAIFTGAHGGKAAITARQWEEFKASRREIAKAGDDLDYAKKKSDEVMAGVYGAVENLKGSWQNLINTIGTANEGLIKSTADMLGNAIDSFPKLDKTTQQALSLAGGGAALAGGAYGAFNLGKALLGFGGGAAALTGSAAALTTSAGLLDAAALKLAGGSIGSGVGAGVGAAAGGAAVGGVSLGLGGTAVAAGGGVVGGALDMLTPGTNGGIGDAILGHDSSLQKTMKALVAERKAAEALQGVESPTIMGAGRTMALPGAGDSDKGYASEYSASRGTLGDFLLGREKKSIVLPQAPQRARAGIDQIQNPPAVAEPIEATALLGRSVPLPPRRPVGLGETLESSAPAAAAATPDVARIDEATAALARYRAELVTVTSEMSAVQGLELPGTGDGLADKQAQLRTSIAETEAKLKSLAAETITPRADGSGLAPLGTAADEAKQKLSALSDITVAPQGNTADIDAVTASARAAAALREVIALGGQAQTTVAKVNAANFGQGGNTGKVREGFRNLRSDTGM